MKSIFLLTAMVILSFLQVSAQSELKPALTIANFLPHTPAKFKIYSRSYGVILGVQRGKYTFIELGVEQHWRKIKLEKPWIFSIGMNMQYNFTYNSLVYQAGFWAKKGRVDFTYGAIAGYFTDFESGKIGISPAIGFRLIGFHLTTGYNFIAKLRKVDHFNTLWISLRYFIPTSTKVKFKRTKKKRD